MVDIWGSIKHTAESLGGAAYAPVGAVVDLATMPFDEGLSFGNVAHALSSRAGNITDPIVNPSTLTGSVTAPILDGMNWALTNGVSEPISAFTYATAHASQNDVGAGALFDGATWSKAYDMAQRDNAGQALAWGLTSGNNDDPFQYKSPYDEETAKDHAILGPALSYGMNAIGAFFLDPAVIGGKALGAARRTYQYRQLSHAQRADLHGLLSAGPGSPLVDRTDKWIAWTQGTNSMKRPLTGPEVLLGTPELRRYAKSPEIVAGLVADANKIVHPEQRSDAIRRILAVAAGDPSQIARLRSEVSESGALADTLTNMVNDSTIDLRKLATVPTLRTDPTFVNHLESQLKNLNDKGSIDTFVDDWNRRLDQVISTHDSMPNLPGVHTAGKRALNRANDTGKLRAPANAHKALDEWASRKALEAQSLSSVYQRGLYTVPLVTMKTAGLLASVYTKAPVAISDALRQGHFIGMAHLHDWGGATAQLDSMMRLARVLPGDRMMALSKAYLAKGEAEQMAAINAVEGLSMKSLTAHYSAKYGTDVSPAFVERLMEEYVAKRGASLSHLRGRSYAATEMSPEMMTSRGLNAQKAEDVGQHSWGKAKKQDVKWRVDQIDEHGTPLSLPLLETHLGNSVPLMDISLADKILSRDHSYFARLARSWEADSLELGRLSKLKGPGSKYIEGAIKARAASMDWSISAGQLAMRAWKFGVLFRLGYPVRVLLDDHMRIASTMRAMTFYGGNARELFSNAGHNAVSRRVTAAREMHNMRVRRQEILDELQGEQMMSHEARRADLRSVEASMRGHRTQIAKLQKQIADGETKRSLGIEVDTARLAQKIKDSEAALVDRAAAQSHILEQLGDYAPEDLHSELGSIEKAIRVGSKKQRPEKRRIGSKDVKLDKDVVLPGAFADEYGQMMRAASGSGDTFEAQMSGVEERNYRSMRGGAHSTLQPNEPGHLHAWADALNNQIRMSPAAMHFVNGGDVASFIKWVKAPEQAGLRNRLAHFAHDPEDWGHRIQTLVEDYIPTEKLRAEVASRRVSAEELDRMFKPTERPAVHGRVVADNTGISHATQVIGSLANRVYKMLGETPTDHLSRHPFFNSLYKQHARDFYAVRKAAYQAQGRKYTQEDLDDISHAARIAAMKDLKRTLFDISAHSHAAHMLRFISPFFAAHQEGIARWWRIAADNPQVIRRFTQAFDIPRALAIEIDDEGNLVKPGAPISLHNRILLQLPKAFGGPETDPTKPGAHWTKWSVSENSFNITFQGGLTNPGLGPFAQMPLEWAAQKYANDEQIARVARIFNPYPPQSPLEVAVPATLKRISALTYAATGHDPSLGLGIGVREYNDQYQQNVVDGMVQFQVDYGREPNRQESNTIMDRAGVETTTQAFHRVLWNSLSPAPAAPSSKYAIIQRGWSQISTQARAEGHDFDWAYDQFKEKFGKAYLPLVFSTSNNPAWVDANPASIAAIKHYGGVLGKIDPSLTRMVIGPYEDQLIEKNASLGEYSPEARNYLTNQQIRSGSAETYYSSDEPRAALDEQMARRGWQKFGELTAALTAKATELGLSSYEDSPVLTALKQAGVAQIRAENYAFNQDYGTFDSTKYDRYLDDMRTIATSPVLARDAARPDIQVLRSYLQLRDTFTTLLDARKAAGMGGPDAAANAGVRRVFTALVGKLVESNTYFENYFYNTAIDRDPLLTGGTP